MTSGYGAPAEVHDLGDKQIPLLETLPERSTRISINKHLTRPKGREEIYNLSMSFFVRAVMSLPLGIVTIEDVSRGATSTVGA